MFHDFFASSNLLFCSYGFSGRSQSVLQQLLLKPATVALLLNVVGALMTFQVVASYISPMLFFDVLTMCSRFLLLTASDLTLKYGAFSAVCVGNEFSATVLGCMSSRRW